MATDKNIKQFTAADIEKYHKGQLSAKEKHDLEKTALDDPFLADALEGYAVAGVNAAADLAELNERLVARTEATRVAPMLSNRSTLSPFMRAAAVILILASAGLLVYQFAFNKKSTETAQAKPVSKEEIRATHADTGSNGLFDDRQKDLATSTEKDITENKKKTSPAGNTAKDETITTLKEKDIDGGKNNEEVTITGEVKSIPAGGAPVATAPAKPTETSTAPEIAAGKGADKEMAREEVKTKAAVAKKQVIAKEGARDLAYQDDSKNMRTVPAGRQADGQTYRNQAMNTFRGRVTDASNVGLPFANVTITRDNVGTYSDANGNFTLTSPDSLLEVSVRSLGYDNSNTQLRNDVASNNVVLQEDRRNLSEVVINDRKPNAAARSLDVNRKLVEPEPADGWEKYDSYLANNLNTPEDFQKKTNTVNSVEVSFEVDKTGKPVNIRIDKSLCPSCDKEAIRLIREGPKWKRNASKKGRTTVTIQF
jgi:Tfp pilus assembly major pilin PilA